MKKRMGDDGGGAGVDDYKKRQNRRKNKQRLGGRGLSLEAFANVKSGPSGYNPAIIKKQREFYKNAKYVSKFKKSLKRERQSEGNLPVASRVEDQGQTSNIIEYENNRKPAGNRKRKKNSLQNLREEFEKKHAEEEKARLEREANLQAKKEERAKAEAKRKALKGKMFKKTRSGQPVMKYRIEHLLDGIVQNSQQ